MGNQATGMKKADAQRRETLAILVGGGPAPGINSVIAAAAIEAMKSGLRVVGLREGFRWLAEGDTSHVDELELEDISRIHLTGGTILGTSRTNPAHDEATFAARDRRAVGARRSLPRLHRRRRHDLRRHANRQRPKAKSVS